MSKKRVVVNLTGDVPDDFTVEIRFGDESAASHRPTLPLFRGPFEGLVRAWWQRFGNRPVLVSKLAAEIAGGIDGMPVSRNGKGISPLSLGSFLQRYRETVVDGLKIGGAWHTRKGNTVWLERMSGNAE